jgi:hypothetical protein
MFLFFSLSFTLLGCSGKDNTSDTASDDQISNDTSDSNDTNDTVDTSDPNAPSVIEADAWCYTQGGSTNVDFWAFSASADDPQGTDTLESFMPTGISFQDAGSGSEIKTIALVCDTTGQCTGSESTETVGIGCAQASDFQAVFTVSDADGNLSAPYTAACRQGTDATGK